MNLTKSLWYYMLHWTYVPCPLILQLYSTVDHIHYILWYIQEYVTSVCVCRLQNVTSLYVAVLDRNYITYFSHMTLFKELHCCILVKGGAMVHSCFTDTSAHLHSMYEPEWKFSGTGLQFCLMQFVNVTAIEYCSISTQDWATCTLVSLFPLSLVADSQSQISVASTMKVILIGKLQFNDWSLPLVVDLTVFLAVILCQCTFLFLAFIIASTWVFLTLEVY